jgi:hypothetical protein
VPHFLSARPDSRIIPLPWDLPLAQWPTDYLVALPRGISRHVVRFIKVGGDIYAAKEVLEHLAIHEYRMLTDIHRLHIPAVDPIGVVTDRIDSIGNPLDPVLITRHLEYSLPYRTLFDHGVRPKTVKRLLNAMVVLFIRLHLAGFLWGDVSLSNVLFRRDAKEFTAYLVDAETAEMHETLSDGQREADLAIAEVNLYGEFCDLKAGGMLDDSLQPLKLAHSILNRYRSLWSELTDVQEFSGSEMYHLEDRIRKLNALGFDVAELDIDTSPDGSKISIQPKVVDAGYNSRRLLRLTGLDVQENQARSLLNDLDTFRARHNLQEVDEAIVGNQWLTQCFQPVLAAVPEHLRGKRDSAQVYHEVLEHRWYAGEKAHREVSITEAASMYVDEVLRKLPEEKVTLDPLPTNETGRMLVNPYDPSQGFVENDAPMPEDPWESQAADEEPTAQHGILDIEALRSKANRKADQQA